LNNKKSIFAKKILMIKRKIIFPLLLNLTFWIIILYIFINYSFLRPFCIQNPYKEILNVVFILIFVYFNYYVLIPQLFLKGKNLLFFIFAIISIFLTAAAEFYLVEYDIKLCCQYISSEKEYHAYLGEIFILLSARDTFFLVLFFLFKIYRNVEESLIIKQKIFANEMKQIVVSISANEEIILAIKDITYIESQKNKTFIHLINGKIYSQYSSLVDMEEILPNELRLRINRSTIIMFKYIISFTDELVCIKTDLEGAMKTFRITERERENSLKELTNYFIKNQLLHKEIKKQKKEEKEKNTIIFGVKKDYFCGVNEKTVPLLEEIFNKPGQNANELTEKFPSLSKRTVENRLKELKEAGKIEYKGASKNGGYYPITEKEQPQ